MILLISLFIQSAMADEKSIQTLYEKGSYAQAIQALQAIHEPLSQEMQMLWGLSAFKLQNFGDAATHFEAVMANNASAKEAAYYLGQSHYALKNLALAKHAFEESIRLGFKVDASNYYIGFIDNLLDQDSDAISRLRKLAKDNTADPEFRQAAALQVGEIYFERAKKIKTKEQSRGVLRNDAIPAYEEVSALDSDTGLAQQASARIEEIRTLLNDDIPRTASGHARPVKSWVAMVSEEVKYDSNIIGEADGKVIKVSNSSSFLNKTSGSIKNEWMFRNWLAATPELGVDHTFHWHRTDPEVFTNDSMLFSPALRMRLDHKIREKPAAGLVEYEFNYTLKDVYKRHELDYYTRTNNFVLGERWQILSIGSTTLKVNYKLSENINDAQNFLAPGILLSQSARVFQSHLLFGSLSTEYQHAKSETFDQRNYKLNLSYTWPKFFRSLDGTVGFNLTITDTMNQRAARGTEKTYNPTLGLTRAWGSRGWFSTSLNYAFTKNLSNDRLNYAYSKHTIGLTGQLIF